MRNKIKEILGGQYNSNRYGSFTDTSLSFKGWDETLQSIVSNVNLYSTQTNSPTDKAAVICNLENKNLACFLVAGGEGDRKFWILAPSGTKSTEFYVFNDIIGSPNINYTFVGRNPKHGFEIKNTLLNMNGNLITVSFELENTGQIPLRIVNFTVTFSGQSINNTDITNLLGKEIGIGEKREIILKINKFYDDPCILFDKNLIIKIDYDAPKFKCDYVIKGTNELTLNTTEFSKPKYSVKSLLLQNDEIEFGCCLKANQCLVNPKGNVNKNTAEEYYNALSQDQEPLCVNTGEFIGDYYCKDGTWISRTRFIALKLLDFVKDKNDFSLFCDDFD